MRAQEIVEAARMAVFTPVEGPTDALRQLAAEYKALCERVNERLARCGELLRKGNRSEAIRLAEIEPNLLDLVALADFPERDSFVELCQYLGLDAAPPLLVEIAAELNEAYAREQPLEGLLRRYRRYALQRAPLKKRLLVLRQLAQIDAQNLYWKKDQETFEKERLREIQRELAEAVQKRDIGVLQALAEELQQPGWLDPPPEALIQTIEVQRNEVSRQIAREELQELTRELHEAWERFDVAEARRVRAAWQQMAQLAQLGENDPLWQEAAAAFGWLAEEDQKEAEEAACRQAMANLERALDRKDKNLPKLQKLYREATRNGRELPTHLERMYQLRVEELQRAAKWRTWRNYAVTLISSFVLTALVVGGLMWYQTYQQYRQTAATLENLLTAIEKFSPSESQAALQQAKALVDQLENQQPSYGHWSPLPELTAKVKTHWEKDRARQEQFQQLLSQVDNILQEPLETLTRNDFEVCQSKFKEAEQFAAKEQEKLRLEQLRSQWEETKLRWQHQKDQQARDQMKPLADQLAQLEKSPSDPPESLMGVQQLVSALSQAAKANPDISDAVRTELAVLREKAQRLEKHLQQKAQELQTQERLVQLVGQHDRFVEALKKHLQEQPDSARGAGYKRLLEEAAYWRKLDQWNEYARQWNSGREERMRLLENQQWLREFESWTGFPGMEAVQKIRPYLEAFQQQADAGKERLQAMLESPPFQDVWVLPHEKKFYYFLQPPKTAPGMVAPLEYIADHDLNTRRVTIQFPENAPQSTIAPHDALCKELLAQLKQTNAANWEKNFCQMIHKVLTTQTEPIPIDPVLRFRLLHELLQTASKGSYPIQQAFSEWRQRLATSPVKPTANWLNPELPEWAEQRRLVAQFLQGFTIAEFTTQQQKAADLWKQLHAIRLPQFQWVGMLQSASNWWNCVLRDPQGLPQQEGELYVLVPKITGGCRAAQIGTLRQGAVQVQRAADPETWLDARPVFLQLQSPEPSQ